MQLFVNQAALERVLAYGLAPTRLRYLLLAVLALALGATVGAAVAAIWLGIALLVDEATRVLRGRVNDRGEVILDLACGFARAAAPALAWASGDAVAALAMLCSVAAVEAASPPFSRRALASTAPSALLLAPLMISLQPDRVLIAACCAMPVFLLWRSARRE